MILKWILEVLEYCKKSAISLLIKKVWKGLMQIIELIDYNQKIGYLNAQSQSVQ